MIRSEMCFSRFSYSALWICTCAPIDEWTQCDCIMSLVNLSLIIILTLLIWKEKKKRSISETNADVGVYEFSKTSKKNKWLKETDVTLFWFVYRNSILLLKIKGSFRWNGGFRSEVTMNKSKLSSRIMARSKRKNYKVTFNPCRVSKLRVERHLQDKTGLDNNRQD